MKALVFESHEHWRDAHRRYVGASMSPALFGCGYSGQSPATVWYDMVNGEEERNDKRLQVGKDMEPALRKIAERELGMKVLPPEGEHIYYVDPKNRMGCTPDGGIYDDGQLLPVELKMVAHGRDAWRDGPPVQYEIQVQHQLAVLEKPRGLLFGVVDLEPIAYWIERNDAFIEVLRKRVAWLMEYVDDAEEPPDDSIEAGRVWALLHPDDNGETVELGEDAQRQVERIEECKEEIKRLKRDKETAELQLKRMIGDNTFGALPDGRTVSLKTQERKEHLVKGSTFRVLRVHNRKG